jgi:hypothetical protein
MKRKKIKTETKIQAAKIHSIHGQDWKLKRRKGTSIWLDKLKDNQAVVAGGKTWHFLMTEKKPKNGVK